MLKRSLLAPCHPTADSEAHSAEDVLFTIAPLAGEPKI